LSRLRSEGREGEEKEGEKGLVDYGSTTGVLLIVLEFFFLFLFFFLSISLSLARWWWLLNNVIKFWAGFVLIAYLALLVSWLLGGGRKGNDCLT